MIRRVLKQKLDGLEFKQFLRTVKCLEFTSKWWVKVKSGLRDHLNCILYSTNSETTDI